MLDKILSSIITARNTFPRSNSIRQEAQDILDQYFKASAVLTSRIWSKHPRSPLRPIPEVQVSTQTNWCDAGRALRARFLEEARGRCDCYSCRSQWTKRGQREKYLVHAVALAQMGDPSTLVKLLNSRNLTQFDRGILADLLDCYFKGEIISSWYPGGRPKNIAAQCCANVAIKFYANWKTINRRWRIKDWGHSDEMKDEACRVAITYLLIRRDREGTVPLISNHPLDEVPDFEQVRELLDRPRSRRR
jgi:hypothetical protein